MAIARRPSRSEPLPEVRAARLRARLRKRAIIQALLGSVFLIGAIAYARSPDRHASANITWMTALVLLSTFDVAAGLRTLALLRRRAAAWWLLGSAAWGVLSVALLGFLLRA
jgi:hypothetical protein